jgi:hypothetical protein
VLPVNAWASPLFSTATLVVEPGTHSYLVRMNNYLGCGDALFDCFNSGELQFQLIAGELRQRSRAGHACSHRAHAWSRAGSRGTLSCGLRQRLHAGGAPSLLPHQLKATPAPPACRCLL